MTRRPAVTLMEVLIAMFIMAIGMMALLALFPVGAVSMAQALKDDRCAYASSMAENVAIVNNVRYGDPNVNLVISPFPPLPSPTPAMQSGMVYVDPYGMLTLSAVNLGVSTTPPSPGIPRISPKYAGSATPLTYGSPSLIDRWHSLPDDIGFNLSGTPETLGTGGIVDRGRRYTWAYLLQRQPPFILNPSLTMYTVRMYAVVYSGRPNPPPPETTLPATGAIGNNGIVINAIGTTLKRGGWILDTSYNPANGLINGTFYRVTNLAEFGNTTTIEVDRNLVANVSQITIMDYVAEVFDKGVGWQQ